MPTAVNLIIETNLDGLKLHLTLEAKGEAMSACEWLLWPLVDLQRMGEFVMAGDIEPQTFGENVRSILGGISACPREWLFGDFVPTEQLLVELVAHVQGYERLTWSRSDDVAENFFFDVTKGMHASIQLALFQMLLHRRPHVAQRIQEAFELIRETPAWLAAPAT